MCSMFVCLLIFLIFYKRTYYGRTYETKNGFFYFLFFEKYCYYNIWELISS